MSLCKLLIELSCLYFIGARMVIEFIDVAIFGMREKYNNYYFKLYERTSKLMNRTN